MAQNTIAEPRTEKRLRMTYAEYQTWDHGDRRLSEWVDGEVTVFAMPSIFHQHLAGFLFRLMAHLADSQHLGEVYFAPLRMLVRDGRSAREPDVLFIANHHLHRLSTDRVEGPADLVVENVSDDSVIRDRREKYLEYQTVRIPEYWIFDSRDGHRAVEAYQLSAQKTYEAITPDPDGTLRSAILPGFFFRPDWLAMDRLPTPASVLGDVV